MKKKFKKLFLSTETVRHLTEPDLREAEGGSALVTQTRPCSECTIPCSICCP